MPQPSASEGANSSGNGTRGPRRILVNDYSGHPFQVELSRELARRGYDVLHLYSADDQTPKGDLLRRIDDSSRFIVEGLTLGEPLQKYKNLLKRRRHERAYGRLMCQRIDAFKPDIVVLSNNPLEAQNLIGALCRRRKIPFVFWLQDVHSEAITSILSQRWGILGSLVGSWYEAMERRLLRDAHHVIAISDTFISKLESWGIGKAKVSVIENWAPKDKINVAPRENAWRLAHGLIGKRVALYTGTIGLKHNPDLLLHAAESFRSDSDVRVVVVSEGKYADYLRDEATKRGLTNLTLLPFQPFESYSDVLATGDVLVAMIEADAASFSVPSKVLSYLCSGRPIVLAASFRNLAAITIKRSGGGVVVETGNFSAFEGALRHFLSSEEAREEAGTRGRKYAEQTFDIRLITDRFEKIFERANCAELDGKAAHSAEQLPSAI